MFPEESVLIDVGQIVACLLGQGRIGDPVRAAEIEDRCGQAEYAPASPGPAHSGPSAIARQQTRGGTMSIKKNAEAAAQAK